METNSASEIVENIVSEQIRDIPGTINISDHDSAFGNTEVDHDKALKVVFEKLPTVGLSHNEIDEVEGTENSAEYGYRLEVRVKCQLQVYSEWSQRE